MFGLTLLEVCHWKDPRGHVWVSHVTVLRERVSSVCAHVCVWVCVCVCVLLRSPSLSLRVCTLPKLISSSSPLGREN